MLQIYVTLATLALLTRDRLATRAHRDDRGSFSVEAVVIALGLFLLAGVLIAGLRVAVQGQMANIR